MMVRAAKSNRTSKDANSFAPCFCSARKEENSARFADIAFLAVSVFLCLLISIIDIIGIISLLLIVITIIKLLCGKQTLAQISWV